MIQYILASRQGRTYLLGSCSLHHHPSQWRLPHQDASAVSGRMQANSTEVEVDMFVRT